MMSDKKEKTRADTTSFGRSAPLGPRPLWACYSAGLLTLGTSLV